MPSHRSNFDAIVIGSGQAGPFLAHRLTSAGWRVALVEREHLGGTCVNDGCMPTKTLVASARAAHMARRAADYGVTLGGPVAVDMKAVKARKDRIVADSIDNLTRWLSDMPQLRLVWGHGRFVGPHAVEVAGQVLEAPTVFINIGGRAGTARLARRRTGARADQHLVMALDDAARPPGGGRRQLHRTRIRADLSALRRAGHGARSRRPPDRARGPRGVARGAGDAGARRRRVPSRRARRARRRSPDGKRIRVDLRAGGAARTVEGSHLFAAVGRRPNTDDLGLDRAGIATDARGFIAVDDHLRTNVPGVWAMGDVNGRGAFTHTSYNDHEIVAANLLDDDARRVSDRIPAYALFTDPPLGRVGMSEAEVRASGRPALVATMPMTRVGRARERGETQGFMKVLVDAETERILGAALLCIEGDEIVHSLLGAMVAGMLVHDHPAGVHIHPTVSELIPTLLGDLEPL